MGCKLVTNNLNGCTYEPWFRGLKGQDLIDYVDSQRDVVVTKIYDKVFEVTNEESKDGDITVILNCYRRPYNLKMQVDSIRAQSVKPVQIWLWINYHEDNKDFDPSTLGVDKVFSNDFNWNTTCDKSLIAPGPTISSKPSCLPICSPNVAALS